MIKLFLILVLLISSNLSFAQFAIINDPEGYCNIRNKAKTGNTICDSLAHGHLVYIIETNANWLNVDYNKNSNNCNGFVYKNKVKLISDFTKLNAATTDNITQFTTENNVTIAIEIEKFKRNTHSYSYFKNNKNQIVKIDNKLFWGTDGAMPTTAYKHIKINYKGKKLELPQAAFDDLFEPNIENTSVHLDQLNNTIYIETMNSDGAGSYVVLWKITNGSYAVRLITHGF